MKKRSISITAVIVAAVICIGIVLATGVMDKASLSGSTAGLLTNKAILFENINPSMSKEEVEAAGLPLNTEPEYEVEASDGVLASITYAVDTRKVSITLDDVAIPSALVQFTEGKLSGITLNTPGAEGVQKIRERLITELGDVQKTQTMDNGRGSSTVDSWEIREEDVLTRIGMVFR